jgi:hypothetical protein
MRLFAQGPVENCLRGSICRNSGWDESRLTRTTTQPAFSMRESLIAINQYGLRHLPAS